MNTSTSISLTEAITTSFYIPTEYLHTCEKYYILHWSARYIYTSLLRSPRVIRENIPYIPVLQEGLTIEWIGANPEAQLRMSFRKLRGHRTGYVIVRKPAVVTTSSSS